MAHYKKTTSSTELVVHMRTEPVIHNMRTKLRKGRACGFW